MPPHPFVSRPEMDERAPAYEKLVRLENEIRGLRGAEAAQKRVVALVALSDEEFTLYQQIRLRRDLAEAERLSASPHLVPNARQRVRTLNRLRFMTPLHEIEALFARQMGGSHSSPIQVGVGSGNGQRQVLDELFGENPIEAVLRTEQAPAWQDDGAEWERGHE